MPAEQSDTKKDRTETPERDPYAIPLKKDLQKYNTDLVKANTEYAAMLDQYVNGLILPMARDFIDLKPPTGEILTDDFRQHLLDALDFAYSFWRMQAHFQDITIDYHFARGEPGCLTGPQLDKYFRMAPSVVSLQGIQEEIALAVAEGVSTQFEQWQSRVIVPSLPWYPLFINVPFPIAPPMVNVPVPIEICISDKVSGLTSGWELQNAIERRLTSSHKKLDQYIRFIVGLCLKMALSFVTKLSTTRVSHVKGTGPVPGYLPQTGFSAAVSGPVIGGWIIPAGPHLT